MNDENERETQRRRETNERTRWVNESELGNETQWREFIRREKSRVRKIEDEDERRSVGRAGREGFLFDQLVESDGLIFVLLVFFVLLLQRSRRRRVRRRRRRRKLVRQFRLRVRQFVVFLPLHSSKRHSTLFPLQIDRSIYLFWNQILICLKGEEGWGEPSSVGRGQTFQWGRVNGRFRFGVDGSDIWRSEIPFPVLRGEEMKRWRDDERGEETDRELDVWCMPFVLVSFLHWCN